MIRKLTPEETALHILQDPVRGRLSADFRLKPGREVWGLFEDKYAEQHEPSAEPLAVICVAYTDRQPRHEMEMDIYTREDGDHAVFYTVWSYVKGAGTRIVREVAQRILEDRPHTQRWITLSPHTETAERFHFKNGARLVYRYQTAQIFEYTHQLRPKKADADA